MIGGPIHYYIVTVNSRFPNKFISISELNTAKVAWSAVSEDNKLVKRKFTPPINLDSFRGNIAGRAIITVRDMAGDTFVKEFMYESGSLHYNREYLTES